MPKKWSQEMIDFKRKELTRLYVEQNLTIKQVGELLNLSPQAIHKRLIRLEIPRTPELKETYRNQSIINKPGTSALLAEFFGIMFGDGHLSSQQLIVTLNAYDDNGYVLYVRKLALILFNKEPSIGTIRGKAVDIIISSRALVLHLNSFGLVSQHKIKVPPLVPDWISQNTKYRRAFLRGIFDTDGCVYKLKHGVQLSFTNASNIVLKQLYNLLVSEGLRPSQISGNRLYLTRRSEIEKYFSIVGSHNPKHVERLRIFTNRRVTQAANEG